MGSIAAQIFSGLSRDVRSDSSPGSEWATQVHSESCSEATPALSGAWGRCLLEGESSPQFEVLSNLVQVCIKDLYFALIILPLDPD